MHDYWGDNTSHLIEEFFLVRVKLLELMGHPNSEFERLLGKVSPTCPSR